MKSSTKIVILVILIILVLIVGYFLFRRPAVLEAKVSEATFARSIEDETAKPRESTTIFQPREDIYLSFHIGSSFRNLPIRIEWYSLAENRQIGQDDTNIYGSRYVSFVAKAPASGWPIDSYQAKIFIDNKEKSRLTFRVR